LEQAYPPPAKYIEQQNNALEKAITDVLRSLPGTSKTERISRHLFQDMFFKFNSNGTVTGTKASSVENGTWSGDVNTKTITSDSLLLLRQSIN